VSGARKPGAGARVLGNLATAKTAISLDELAVNLNDLKRNKITAVVSRLITDSYVVRRSNGSYQVTKEGIAADAAGYKPGPQRKATGQAKPKPNSLRQKIWKTLRLRRRISTLDLLANVCDGDPKVQRDGVYKYLKALELAGYVQMLGKRVAGTAPTSNGYKIALLLNDTGALAPMVNWKTRRLTDPNIDQIIDFSEVSL